MLDLANRCGANVSIDDIDRSHRVGRSKEIAVDEFDISDELQETTKTREIIVKVRTHGARLQLLKGRAFFREKKEKILLHKRRLNEIKKNLAFSCRELRRDSKSKVAKNLGIQWKCVYSGR